MSIWQTSNWQKMLKKSGQVIDTFELNNIFIEKRSIWLWEYGLFVLGLEKTEKISKNICNELIRICKRENALFIQIENIHYWDCRQNLCSNFKKKYYKKFITPYTAVINLEETEEEILSKMKPKWRYNIKLAKKKWIEIKEVDKTLVNVQKFYSLIQETTKRDWFKWNSLEYYMTFLNSIEESKLLLAFYEGVVISWWIFTYVEDTAIYYYWASSSALEYRNLMAPYLLQWEAISIWKKKSCKIYDFLWVSSPEWWDLSLKWVTDFKKKFTSDIRQVSESYIYINKSCKYFLLNILRKLKNIIK